MKKIIKLAKDFDKKVKEIINGIKTGVQLMKDIINGKFSIKDIVAKFVDALQELPGKVGYLWDNDVWWVEGWEFRGGGDIINGKIFIKAIVASLSTCSRSY